MGTMRTVSTFAAPTRAPLVASAATAHPSARAMDVAAMASAADAPPPMTNNPRLALVISDKAARHASSSSSVPLNKDKDEDAPTVNGADDCSQRSRPFNALALSHATRCGPRGSRNAQFKCTGPGLAPRKYRSAVAAIVAHARAGAPSPGGAKSAAKRAYDPKILTWSIVWFAPVSRSSYGRSAVSNNKGVELSEASTTAGSKFATAVPLLQMTAAGRNDAPFA
mmetsp:Transcript_7779/g.28617  ORF Transcript_7779/g.28617 Transcript_7779/m.28617 type:complete len:224 (+) Transcript_7779:3601-4272(+)